MRTEIEFSVISENEGSLRRLLDQFEYETGIHVNMRLLDWGSAWNALVRSALYNDGLDVSEVGTTWAGDLIGMNALRQFTAHDIDMMGHSAAFLPVAWTNAFPEDDKIWSIPWLTGSRVILYRPSLFEQAGIDPVGAFSTPSTLEDTARTLREHGISAPWTFEAVTAAMNVHNLSTWIWAEGGDFVNPDGKTVAFMEPGTLEGLRRFFNLFKYIDPDALAPGSTFAANFFGNPNAAMAMTGTWLFRSIFDQPEVRDQLAVALPPGPAFVGGSDLVIWKNSRHHDAALRLVQFLTQNTVQVKHSQAVGLLPARLSALNADPFSSDHFWQVASQALLSGRSFPNVRLWGLIEDRLKPALDAVTKEVLAHPAADPMEALVRHLKPLRQRLNMMLSTQ